MCGGKPWAKVGTDRKLNCIVLLGTTHSAPAGIATGSPCASHAPALLAQHNAAARAFRFRCSGLIAGLDSFAYLANIHQANLSGVETGKRNPSILVVERIAKALGVDVSEIFKSN